MQDVPLAAGVRGERLDVLLYSNRLLTGMLGMCYPNSSVTADAVKPLHSDRVYLKVKGETLDNCRGSERKEERRDRGENQDFMRRFLLNKPLSMKKSFTWKVPTESRNKNP